MGARGLISRGDDERRQTSEWFSEAHERVSQQLGRRQPPVDVHLQAVVEEVLEYRRQLVALLYLWLAIRRYEIQRLQHTDEQLGHVISNMIMIFRPFHIGTVLFGRSQKGKLKSGIMPVVYSG